MLWNEAQRPKWRIGLAIALSLLVHYLMAGSWFPTGHRSHGENASPLPSLSGLPSGISASLMPAVEEQATSVAAEEQQELRHIPDERNPAAVADTGSGAVADDRYYSARELDRYPMPAAALDLSGIVPAGIAGRIRVFVDVDLDGRVVGLAVIEGDPPGRIEAALREILQQTSFTPASKDGRAVNSRVMMEFRAP